MTAIVAVLITAVIAVLILAAAIRRFDRAEDVIALCALLRGQDDRFEPTIIDRIAALDNPQSPLAQRVRIHDLKSEWAMKVVHAAEQVLRGK